VYLAYNTNGFAHHRLEEALAVLADLGYAGVALTPDVPHLDLATTGPREWEALRRRLEHLGLACVVETGGRYVLDPRRKHWPNLVTRDPGAAERRVATAFNRVGEARTAKLPRISLTAAVTSISSELFVLQDRDNPVVSAGAAITQPLFLGGALQAQEEVRDAELKAAISEPPFGEVGQALVDSLSEERRGAAMLALAVAMGSGRPRINLLPAALRPLRASRGQMVTGLMLGLTVLLGIGFLGAQVWQRERYVRQISQEIQRLDSEAKSVERLTAAVNKKRQLVATLKGIETQGLRSLPFLRDLTGLIPQDAWLQALNMDAQGVELIGQAGTASALIPALEASPWLDRVEFTSPVTKGQGREQFRLHGSWERH